MGEGEGGEGRVGLWSPELFNTVCWDLFGTVHTGRSTGIAIPTHIDKALAYTSLFMCFQEWKRNTFCTCCIQGLNGLPHKNASDIPVYGHVLS